MIRFNHEGDGHWELLDGTRVVASSYSLEVVNAARRLLDIWPGRPTPLCRVTGCPEKQLTGHTVCRPHWLELNPFPAPPPPLGVSHIFED